MTIFRNVLSRLVGRIAAFPGNEPPSTPPAMVADDREIIVEFALGNTDLRDRAVAIHRRYIPILGVRGTPEMRYMAEVDHRVPDFALMGYYRDVVLGRAAA
jgi:hypothetical protein